MSVISKGFDPYQSFKTFRLKLRHLSLSCVVGFELQIQNGPDKSAEVSNFRYSSSWTYAVPGINHN